MKKEEKEFVKVRLVSHQWGPYLKEKDFSLYEVRFPLYAKKQNVGYISADEIGARMEDALRTWASEVGAPDGTVESCLHEIMKEPGAYLFTPSGETAEVSYDMDFNGIFETKWRFEDYHIRAHTEDAYFEDAAVFKIDPEVPAMAVAQQSSFDAQLSVRSCPCMPEFWRLVRNRAKEDGLLDMFASESSTVDSISMMIGGDMSAHFERFTESEHAEMKYSDCSSRFGVYYTEGDHCYALMCAPVEGYE